MSNELKQVNSYFRAPSTYGYSSISTLSGGFGVSVSKTDNIFTVSLDSSVFSGSGGISVTTSGGQIIVSGSSTSQSTVSQPYPSVLAINQTTDINLLDQYTFTQFGSLSGSLLINSGSVMMINFCATFTVDSTGFGPISYTAFRVLVDGTVISGSGRAQACFEQSWPEDITINCISLPLTGGTHTVAVQWSIGSAGRIWCLAGSEPGVYSAWLIAQEATQS